MQPPLTFISLILNNQSVLLLPRIVQKQVNVFMKVDQHTPAVRFLRRSFPFRSLSCFA